MTKIWIGVAVVAIAAAVAVAAMLGVFSGPERPVAPAASIGGSAATGGAGSSEMEVTEDDHVLGSPDAPVTIIEYASLTCPHCAHFHEQTLPQIKTDYIDTGKVRLVFRDFPLDAVALRAAALAECVPKERYFGILSILFESQGNWATASDPLAALAVIGKTAGLSDADITRCTTDEAHLDTIVEERMTGDQRYSIRSTPSFIIGGKTYSGMLTTEQMRELLDPLVQ